MEGATQHWRVASGPQSLRTVVILGILMAFASISTDLYLPAMPSMAEALGTDAGHMEWSIAAYLAGFTLGQLAWGPLSDRHGRRRPVAGSLLVFILGCAGCAMSGSVGALVCWRAVQAAGASASVVIARAMVRDLYRGPRAARLMSTLMTVMAVAPLLGPSVGGLILQVASWRAIFWTLAAFGGATLAALSWLPETLPPARRTCAPLSAALGAYGQLLRHRALLGYAGVAGCYFGACFAYVAGSPFLYIAYFHVSPQWYGMLFTAGVSGIMLANQINIRLLKRFSADALIRFGTGMAALAGAVAALDAFEGWGHLCGVAIPLVFVVAANGFISANAIAGALSHFDEGAGAVSALLGSVQYGTGMVGSVLVGTFAGARSTLNVIAWMCVASMLCAWLFLPGRAGKRHAITSPVQTR